MQDLPRENWLRCPDCRSQFTIGPPLRDPAQNDLACPCCGVASSALDLLNSSLLEELELVDAILKLRGVVQRLSGVDLLAESDKDQQEDELTWSAQCHHCGALIQASGDIHFCPHCSGVIHGLRRWRVGSSPTDKRAQS